MVPVFRNAGEMCTVKNFRPVSLLSVVSKVFEKIVNNRLADHQDNMAFFLISSMALVLVDKLQIF